MKNYPGLKVDAGRPVSWKYKSDMTENRKHVLMERQWCRVAFYFERVSFYNRSKLWAGKLRICLESRVTAKNLCHTDMY